MDRSAPHELLYATEPARALAGLAAWPLLRQVLRAAPHGDGRPVLVLPGLLAGDLTTTPLRALLADLGHAVHGWRLGRNVGPTPRVQDGLQELLLRLADRYDGPVSLVGWSLGGIYARSLAAQRPDLVAQVITLGTPFAMVDPGQTRAQSAYDRYAHLHASGSGPAVPIEVRSPMPVPATSVWSRTDGIVSWRASLETPSPTAENVPVLSSHLGLGHSPTALYAVADRLAQPEGSWSPFVPPRWLRPLYPAAPLPVVPEVTSRAA